MVAEEKLLGVEAPLRSAALLLVTGAIVAAVVEGAVAEGAFVAGAFVGGAVVAAIGVNSAAETALINLLTLINLDSGCAPGAASGLGAAGGLVLAAVAVAASGCAAL